MVWRRKFRKAATSGTKAKNAVPFSCGRLTSTDAYAMRTRVEEMYRMDVSEEILRRKNHNGIKTMQVRNISVSVKTQEMEIKECHRKSLANVVTISFRKNKKHMVWWLEKQKGTIIHKPVELE